MDEKVNRDENGEADGMNLEVDSKDEVMLGLGRVRVSQVRVRDRVSL